MSAARIGLRGVPLVCAASILAMLLPGGAEAAPVKLVLASHFGREVNLTETAAKAGPELEDVCAVKSGDACQPGRASSVAGGFEFPQSVAGGPAGGDVYVADPGTGEAGEGNHRIQVLTATGKFVLMFGKDVNETTGGDVCTHEEEVNESVKCKAGVGGGAAGQIGDPVSVAADAAGHVYVAEYLFGNGTFGQRIQEFTAAGHFVLEIGRKVNKTTGANLCTHEEEAKGVECGEPDQREIGSPFEWGGEEGAFNFLAKGDVIVAGGPEDLLYVGDEGRIQVFKANGEPVGVGGGEIPLAAGARVGALTLDPTTGDLYLTYEDELFHENSGTVERLDATGNAAGAAIVVQPREADARVTVVGLSVDAEGRLAAAAEEVGANTRQPFGALYRAASGLLVTTFSSVDGVKGIGFNGEGDLFAAVAGVGQEVLAYTPEPVGELTTGSANCLPGADRASNATFDCTLSGAVNPEGVSETVAWFSWGEEVEGKCLVTMETTKQQVGTSEVLSVKIDGVRPNVSYCYQLIGEDRNVKAPERLTGERRSIAAPLAAPRILGAPSVSFVKGSSVVMSGMLNPENAHTRYFFEYTTDEGGLAQCPGLVRGCPAVASASCSGVSRTPAGKVEAYGPVGAALEASGLQPDTFYSYRLAAEDESRTGTERCAAVGQVGTFVTAPAAAPSAETGPYGDVSTTGALISGVVSPDGVPVSYSFEVGVYEGAGVVYATAFSGSAGSAVAPVREALLLTGLQPGTTYAYRITVKSGYIENASHSLSGQPVIFTTAALGQILGGAVPQGVVPVLTKGFPTAPGGLRRCRRGYARSKKNARCVKRRRKKTRKTANRKGRR